MDFITAKHFIIVNTNFQPSFYTYQFYIKYYLSIISLLLIQIFNLHSIPINFI